MSIASMSAQGQRNASGHGYDYTVSITARESGGGVATLTAWDVIFYVGSAPATSAHLDHSSNWGTLAATLSAYESSVPQQLTITDTAATAYPTNVTVKLSYSYAGGGLADVSLSGGVTPLNTCAGLSVTPTDQSVDPNGAKGRVAVTAASDCQWSASVNSIGDWLSLQNAHGSGNGAITFVASSNTTDQFRNAAITVGNDAANAVAVVDQNAIPKPQATLTWTLQNTCSYTNNARFFDETAHLQWPADTSQVYALTPGGTFTLRLSCTQADQICAGGGNTVNGTQATFGVGLSNNQHCSNCCFSCANVSTGTWQITNCLK